MSLRSFHRWSGLSTQCCAAKLQGDANSLSALQPLPLPRPSVISPQLTQKHDGSITQEEISPIFHEHIFGQNWFLNLLFLAMPLVWCILTVWHLNTVLFSLIYATWNLKKFTAGILKHPRFTPPSVASLPPWQARIKIGGSFQWVFVEPNPDLKRNLDHEHTLGLGRRGRGKVPAIKCSK